MPEKVIKPKSKKKRAVKTEIPEPLRIVLEARGWHYPPTDEEVKQRSEALKRFAGAISTEPEILYAVAMDTDPSRLGLKMEDLGEMKRRAEKDAGEKT